MAAAFRAAALRLRVAHAFLPAARRLRVAAAFTAASDLFVAIGDLHSLRLTEQDQNGIADARKPAALVAATGNVA